MARNLNCATLNRRDLPFCFQCHSSCYQRNWDGNDHKYTLMLSALEKNVEGGVEHHSKAELIQTDAQGTVSQRLVLYQSELLETID